VGLIGAAVLLVLVGGVASLAPRRRSWLADRTFRAAVPAGCALAAAAALRVLGGRPGPSLTLQPALPGGAWVVGLDGLSAWFLLVIALAGGIATLFGAAYLEPERHRRPVAAAHVLWSILLAAMMGVVVAGSAVAFLLAWEVMAVSAYLLIMFEHDHENVRRSGLVYLVLTHVGTLGLLAMFISWGHAAGDFTFARFAAAGRSLPWAGAGILLLALVGFGIKAGVFPFHFWLPGAHAAAPSHVSALLSGVMLKMGIYGLLRVIMLVGTPPAWWGWTVLLLGLASSVLGVLWALAQHDLKRALAYSSVENIGIILLGIGLGALGTAYHQPAVALLGYAGALLHVLNHSLFKSLLFLGAGAVVRETGTREIDRMGGLARSMPRTAAAFLIGAVAIVGLPPLNGFVSEWLIFRGLLGAGVAGGGIRVAAPVAVGLALTGALALACFSKLFGVVFLGVPRGSGERAADESWLFAPQWALAGACVAIGLAPGFVVSIVLRAAASLVPGASGDVPGVWRPSLALSALSALLLVVTALAWWARVHARRPRAASVTWGCAYPVPTPRMQYTASSYASPLLAAFGPITGIHEERSAGAFQSHAADPILDRAAEPLWAWLQAVAARVRVLQGGFVRRYLLYSIVCLMGLLLYLRFRALP
jgi:hydrogenase-4 component B